MVITVAILGVIAMLPGLALTAYAIYHRELATGRTTVSLM
jgi:hypothetical protein